MITRRHMRPALALVAALALALAACGDDGGDGEDEGDAEATETTEAAGATAGDQADGSDESGAEGGAAADGEAAVTEAVTTVFDSAVPFEDKVALIQDGEAHRADHEGYVAAADAVGGITVEPTEVAVEGDAATVTYRVLFGGNEAYRDLTMELGRQGDAWVVPTDTFCGFLASARTPCAGAPAGG